MSSRKIATWIIVLRRIAPEKNYLPEICALDDCSRIIAPENYLKDNCPLTISPWKLSLTKIAFRMICRLHNCPSDKWSRENCPQVNGPKDKLHPRYFFSKNQKLIDSSLIEICFLLFSSLWFKLVLDFDFCIRKLFINPVRPKLVWQEEQVKDKLDMEELNRFAYAFATDRDWQGLPAKNSWNSVQEEVNCKFIYIFSRLAIVSIKA